MSPPENKKFSVKVGFLGNVSAGKTTLMNALFRDQFGATDERRCTSGVHHYRVQYVPPKSKDDVDLPPKRTIFQRVLLLHECLSKIVARES